MNVIIRESERLSGLVEELLDFSRLQNNRMRLMVTKLDILAELDEAVYMFTDRARTEGKQLHYEETPSLPPVYGDVDRLRQVFVNIIDNALKYTRTGGTITVSSRQDNGWVEVTISDTGCGIPAEHLPNVKKNSTRPTSWSGARASGWRWPMRSSASTAARWRLKARKAWAPL